MDNDVLDQRVRLSRLFDLYGCLLSDGQREAFVMHEEQDMSLTEISSQIYVTRQAISAALCKARSRLNGFEDDMGFLKLIEEMAYIVDHELEEGPTKDKLKKLLNRKNSHVR